MPMHLIADEQIPLVKEYFSQHFDITFLSSDQIRQKQFSKADVLLTRSNIKIDAVLLRDTDIRFVGCAVSGEDHIVKADLNALGISYFTAPGCNAHSVADYVTCSIAYLKGQNFFQQKRLRAGVIGVGRIGKIVANRLKILGFEVILNDPPRALNEPDFSSTSLEAFEDLDLICIHTPFIKEGIFSTYHLIEKKFLQRQKPGCIILNAGRGDVISLDAVKQYGQHLLFCLDVWPNEPNIDLALMQRCLIATPHIAGYAIQAKWRGTAMLQQYIYDHFHLPLLREKIDWPIEPPVIHFDDEKQHDWIDAVLAIYHPYQDHQIMLNMLDKSTHIGFDFQQLRKNYFIRHELSYPFLVQSQYFSKAQILLQNLGCRFKGK